MRRYLFIALAAVFLVASAFTAATLSKQSAAAASPCQFQKSTSTVAFCDTFDQAAAANASRSGALNPTVWGVSELSVLDNPSQGMDDEFVPATAPSVCGGGSVLPPKNIQICNGQLFDTANDGGSQTLVAMYPRQPFDIAGRTGDVSFDVSNDSLDGHAAWPTFVYTDQPVPAPYESAAGIDTYARNSIGFTMAGQVSSNCPGGQWSLDTMFETVSYRLQSVSFTRDACVTMSNNPTVMNHVEVQISSSSITVWASNAGTSNLVEIANASPSVPLTRGLIWMEDVHYNAGKYTPGQENNTFGWDNVGFDGPILPRDRGFDVPDNTAPGRDAGSINTGWNWSSQSDSVQTLPVDATSLAAAQGALVEFDWFPDSQIVPSFSLNGHPVISTAWPFSGGSTDTWRTIAVTVPLSEVVQGANTISVEQAPSSQGSIANFNLILQGAGGVPTCLDPSSCSSAGSTSGSSNPTPTPSSAHSPTPTATPSARPTPTPSSTPTPSKSPTPTPKPTPRPTATPKPTPRPTPTPTPGHHHHRHYWG